jgi:hypothetical protein
MMRMLKMRTVMVLMMVITHINNHVVYLGLKHNLLLLNAKIVTY